MSNIIVAQSGGPTVAINASLVGVIKGAKKSGKFDKIYGALHGINGVISENFIELQGLDEDKLSCIYSSPACYLGSCRYKMPPVDEDTKLYEKVFEILERYDISAVFYIGGNDSMDTITKLSVYGERRGSDIRFAGVPKTIDNDLIQIDHTPGYGSAAKFIAQSMLEIAHDTAIYEVPCVTIVEIMGRNAGWLTAAAALARNEYSQIPQLIYLPEIAFDIDRFISDVEELLKVTNNVVVAVSEGIKDSSGAYLSAQTAANDKFGHAQLSGAGKCLEMAVKSRLKIKCRSVELNILQRAAAHAASKTDLDEAQMLGEKAVSYALEGNSGFMPILKRVPGDVYSCTYEMGKLSEIANKEKNVPREWINEAGNDVTQDMIDYVQPLILGEVKIEYKNGLPSYIEIPHLVTSRN